MTHQWPDWSGKRVACIGTGPSLTEQQLRAVALNGAKVIAINDAGLLDRVPFSAGGWCDLWYAADLRFWRHYAERVPHSRALRVAAQKEAVRCGLAHLFLDTKSGLSGAGHARSGGHSGFQAVQIALNAGAALVELHGYDCHAPTATNYFGDKPRELATSSPYAMWVEAYRTLDRSRVVNCTPGSAIDAFEFQDWRAVA
jgi:hypothetical protein